MEPFVQDPVRSALGDFSNATSPNQVLELSAPSGRGDVRRVCMDGCEAIAWEKVKIEL